ncbi:MAG: radical SAM protein [Thermodesulfovibrio sp.]|nr:radical SAM protein [Thermodesulfovibrio sp.]
MRIGLIDADSKIPNFALLQLSAYHKAQGDEVILNPKNASEVDKVYASVLFSWNKDRAEALRSMFPNIAFGGTGYDLNTELPCEVQKMRPDYALYTREDIAGRIGGIMTTNTRVKKAETIVNAGLGYTHRGCVRRCGFCVIKDKKGEGDLHRVAELKDLMNPKSNVLILLNNNFTASPSVMEEIAEIRERNLIVDLCSGIDIRTMTPEIAQGLQSIKHLRSLHYAFDLCEHESMVVAGIKTLSRFIKVYRHMCFVLTGYNTSFQEDMHRVRVLLDLGVSPYIMLYNRLGDIRDRHYQRFINSRIYKVCPNFDDYHNWAKSRHLYFVTQQLDLAAA